MKNTTGYSLNAFLDFDTPAQILSHLMIGAEGTLGFIAEAVLKTIPDLPLKYTGLLIFPSLHAACDAIMPLRDAGAATIELMDRASLRSVESKPGMRADLASLPQSAAALLIEFHSATFEADQLNRLAAERSVQSLALLVPALLTGEAAEQAQLWSIRKGLFPSVGAVRARGTSVIIEDVAFPVERLAEAATDLKALFKRHGYSEAILFGHAKDGNLHFVITQGFETAQRVAQYRAFIEDVVSLVVDRYDGALKAEHGTGRNTAPFVEAEWGPEAFAIMHELKSLVDPENLLNPGVILNPHSDAHIRDLKLMPEVEPEIDRCIECGYCEPMCPSRDLTLTPRQRIVVRRAMVRRGGPAGDLEIRAALDRDFPYMVLDTCAVDGLCATSCPVDIDTGSLTKHLRVAWHSRLAHRAALAMANRFSAVEAVARRMLGAGHLLQSFAGLGAMIKLTQAFDALSGRVAGEAFWKWCAEMPHPRKGPLPSETAPTPDAVYFPICISRIMGALPGESDKVTAMMRFWESLDAPAFASLCRTASKVIAAECLFHPKASTVRIRCSQQDNRELLPLVEWRSGAHRSRHQPMHLRIEDVPGAPDPREPRPIRQAHHPELHRIRLRAHSSPTRHSQENSPRCRSSSLLGR
jgi:D-lactate dehydrogenase